MSAYVLKAASKPRDYVLDWRSGYLQPMETIVDDLGWSIHSPEDSSHLKGATHALLVIIFPAQHLITS